MKVSVIVPVYNSQDNLRTCLDSLIKQTLQEIEIIAIDDNSTDNSLNVLKEYKMKYPNKIEVLHNERNIGQANTRNRGIELAKGEYIGFVDSDDYVNYEMYQTMYEGAIHNNYPEIVVTGIYFVKDDYYIKNNLSFLKRGKGTIYHVLDHPDFILNMSPSACNKLFRRDIIQNKMFLAGKMWEDVAFSFAKMFNSNRILYYQNADYFYRRQMGIGVSAKAYNINQHLLDIFEIADQIEKETKEKNRFELLKKQIRFVQIFTCLQRTVEIMEWPISESNKDYLIKIMSNIIIKKYGDWRKLSDDELSSRIGFLQLEKLRELTINTEQFSLNNLKNKLVTELNTIKKNKSFNNCR